MLESALNLPEGDRTAYVRRHCGLDKALCLEILEMLDVADAAVNSIDELRRAAGGLLGRAMAASAAEPRESAETLIGRRVSHYRIEEYLGAGGMGVVYRATDERLRRSVALKFLSGTSTSDAIARGRFALEAQAASALDHDNICTVYDIGEAPDGRTFTAMAYYEGETLDSKIAGGPLTVADAIRYARQIADGLRAAHKKDIIHRDVKPSNVIVTTENRIKLLDFGVAKLGARTQSQDGRLVGTVAYMSPEQARGNDIDARSDLWSLGAVLYEMLCGRRAFRRDSTEAVLYAIEHEEPRPVGDVRPGIPPWVEEVVERLLRKDPDERFASAEQVVAALDRSGSGASAAVFVTDGAEATSTGHVESVSEAGKPMTRWSRLMAIAAITLRKPIPSRVVVLPFENRTGRSDLDALGVMAADWVVQGLADAEVVQVLPLVSVLGILKGAAGPEDAMLRLVRATRAGTAILGSMYRRDQRIEYQCQVLDLRHRSLRGAIEPMSVPVAEPDSGIPELRERIIMELTREFDPLRPVLGRRGVPPPRLDAYRAFLDALRAMWDYDYRTAIACCDRGAELDPSFMFVHLHAAAVHINIEEYEQANRRLELVAKKRDTLDRFQRISFDMWNSIVDGGPAAGLHQGRTALEIAQNPPTALLVARLALDANRPKEAVDALVRFGPRHGDIITLYWYTLVEGLLMLGKPRRALRAARAGRRLHSADLTVVLAEALALAALARPRAVDALLRTCASLDAQHFDHGAVMEMVAARLAAAGRMAASREVLEEAEGWYSAHIGESSSPPGASPHLARCLYSVGRWEEAEELFGRIAESREGDYISVGYQAASALRMGNAAAAGTLEDHLRRAQVTFFPGRVLYMRARLAAIRGQRDKAVELLRDAFRNGQGALWTAEGPFLPVRIDPHFRFLRGFDPFERLVRPAG